MRAMAKNSCLVGATRRAAWQRLALFLAPALLCSACLPSPKADLRLHRVVFYQSGVGHFELRGRLGKNGARLPVRAHEVGDVLKTSKEATESLILQVEGKSKFAGKIGQFRGNRSFRVTRLAKPGEKV